MIRLTAVLLLVTGFLIFSIPVLIFEWILGKFNKKEKGRQCRIIIQGVFRLLLKVAGADIRVRGRENIPEDEAVLFVGNHRSDFDILIAYIFVKTETGFIAKREIGRIPLLKQWMDNIKCLFLDRNDVKQGLKVILKAVENVKEGISVWIYPEGTRNKNENVSELMEFHDGSLKIAAKSKCKIIPVAMVGADNLFERHFPLVKPAKVLVEFGEPVLIDELPADVKKKPGKYLKEHISQMLLKLQEEY